MQIVALENKQQQQSSSQKRKKCAIFAPMAVQSRCKSDKSATC